MSVFEKFIFFTKRDKKRGECNKCEKLAFVTILVVIILHHNGDGKSIKKKTFSLTRRLF